MMKKREVPHVCLLLLAVLQISTLASAQNTLTTISPQSTATNLTPALRYQTRPVNVNVSVGEPAVFNCGVPEGSPNLTFTFYGNLGNYTLTCPHGHVEDSAKALYGSCEMKNGESSAEWTLKGTSLSDNGTKVICQQSKNLEAAAAVLHVYVLDNGVSHATLIGCLIGGFFGILLVFVLLYIVLQSSGTLQRALCLQGDDTEDDLDTIVTKD
ncbi:uncharacterized protein LOC121641045 [Melanotaenia boesemani]|uniref:uncharacterized protein LOC121641045 n=1 Tax=Melanotaenia boesemani TaxID=1250792 RepID=UPI001C0448F8|nr:uncharacterized protein LOC121641045 [Melanotaenia boesemani]